MTPAASFPRSARLSGAAEFAAVWGARQRCDEGWIAFAARANGLGLSRVGLSVGRRAGIAVVRSRTKRLAREAFRLERHGLPSGLDIVVAVRSPGEHTLAEYRTALSRAARELAIRIEGRDRPQRPPRDGT